MEPPDVYDDICGLNNHYAKENAWEQQIRKRLKSKETRKCIGAKQPFDVDHYMNTHGYDQMHARKKHLQATKDNNFDLMWPLVHTICESLQFEPEKWEFGEHRFKHIENGSEFWCHKMNFPVTETFMMGEKTTDQVFNRAQGEAILEAVKIAMSSRPSGLQTKLLGKFGLADREVVDERHIIHLPQMTFWQRLLFLLTARCKIS